MIPTGSKYINIYTPTTWLPFQYNYTLLTNSWVNIKLALAERLVFAWFIRAHQNS